MTGASWTRYVALGDSLTENFVTPEDDAVAADRASDPAGWAERLGGILDEHSRLGGRDFQFVDLSAQETTVARTLAHQIPRAIAGGADLVSIVVGVRDVMGSERGVGTLTSSLAGGVAALRASGADVLLSNSFDPQFAPFLRPYRTRTAVFNAHVWSIARETGAVVFDVWGIREFQDQSMWSADRLGLSPSGHRLLAARAAHTLGIPYAEIAARISPATDDTGASRSPTVDSKHVYFLGSAGLDRL